MILRIVAIFAICFPVFATNLTARVVDVGAGLCVVIKAPGGNMVYDAGHWNNKKCRDAIIDLLGDGTEIDLMVISHSDSDHLGNAKDILERHSVKHIIRTGYKRGTNTWKNFNQHVGNEVVYENASVSNLSTMPLTPGDTFDLGKAKVTFIYGLSEWTHSHLDSSEMRNVISIVMKIDYAGKSILLPGDTIGRGRNDTDDACKEAEKEMVDNHPSVSIDSNVLVAPHHGGNNASSKCFIEAVNPEYVIFSAGHAYNHPRKAVAERYLNSNINISKMFRTDFGDVAGSLEWEHGAIDGCVDKPGDDDVNITIDESGALTVVYRSPQISSCN